MGRKGEQVPLSDTFKSDNNMVAQEQVYKLENNEKLRKIFVNSNRTWEKVKRFTNLKISKKIK